MTLKSRCTRIFSLDEKILLAFHQVTIPEANGKLEELLEPSEGVNVIVPTWFTLSSNDGDYESLASRGYVDKAHEKGLQVWAMLDNFSKECSKTSSPRSCCPKPPPGRS